MVNRELLMAGLVALLALPASLATADTTLYVATNGSDANPGTLEAPLATLAGARDAIRNLQPLQAPVTVQLRGGVYFVAETITFGPEDSGTPDAPITYAAYPGEKPVLSGGRRITGLQPGEGKLLTVTLPEVAAGEWSFRQLFVDGKRQVRARCPNFDPADPYRGGFFNVCPGQGGFGVAVGCIHNVGDWMKYEVTVPADGDYAFWMLYGAENASLGTTDMGGHTVLIVDDGEPVPLMSLPDSGGWEANRWSKCAAVNLTTGAHTMVWKNIKGGGINLEAYALSDDPDWTPVTTDLRQVAAGKHLVVIQAEDFVAFNGPQLAVVCTGGSKDSFYYRPGDFKLAWVDAPGAEVHIFQSGDCRAFKEIITITGLDEATSKVFVGGPEATSLLGTGDRYFVENLREELDAPGEWYLDEATGVLTYYPQEGFATDSVVIAPVVGRVIELLGTAEEPVSHLRFSVLTIRDSEYFATDGCSGYNMGNDGALFMGDATHCAVEDCTFVNAGKAAVCITRGGDNAVVGNEIADSAEGGVLLLSSARNTVTDNHIHDIGAVYKHNAGVTLEGAGTDDNLIAHNSIHHVPRYGISIKTGGFRNVIEYNGIHFTSLETYDTGGIEVTQQDRDIRSGSIIRHNVVGDTIGYSYDSKQPVYLSWGIYLDSFAGGYTVTDNICYRSQHGGIMFQGGKDNRVENNIFVDGKVGQGHICNFADNSEGLVLERNIFAWSDPNLTVLSTGRLDEKVIRIGSNLYFPPHGQDFTIGWGTWADWQKRGFDKDSLIADPLFTDPARDDYALKPDSPAFKLGFRPIDISTVGPRKRNAPR